MYANKQINRQTDIVILLIYCKLGPRPVALIHVAVYSPVFIEFFSIPISVSESLGQSIYCNQNLCRVFYFWDFLGIYGLFRNFLVLFLFFFFDFRAFFYGLFWILEDMEIRKCPKCIGT